MCVHHCQVGMIHGDSMGSENGLIFIDENGKRLDGRGPEDLRPIKMEVGVLKRADGSAYVEWGKNKVLAAVYGPRELHPKHLQESNRGVVQTRYNMAPFSVSDRKRPGPDRRSVEISKIISEAFTHVVFVEHYPRTTVDIFIEVLQANAGTRCAGITAASLALADAGVPMRGLVSSCAAGKIAGRVVLDLNKEEDNYGEADMPLAVLSTTGEILLLQVDGDLTREEFRKAFEMASRGCERIAEMQRQALKERFTSVSLSGDAGSGASADAERQAGGAASDEGA